MVAANLTITAGFWVLMLLGLYAFFKRISGDHSLSIGDITVNTTSTAIILFVLALGILGVGVQAGLTPLQIIIPT